jgi:hypothetical protein
MSLGWKRGGELSRKLRPTAGFDAKEREDKQKKSFEIGWDDLQNVSEKWRSCAARRETGIGVGRHINPRSGEIPYHLVVSVAYVYYYQLLLTTNLRCHTA